MTCPIRASKRNEIQGKNRNLEAGFAKLLCSGHKEQHRPKHERVGITVEHRVEKAPER